MLATDRWRKWVPPAQIIGEDAEIAPPKPSKDTSGGFEGAIPGNSPIISGPPEPAELCDRFISWLDLCVARDPAWSTATGPFWRSFAGWLAGHNLTCTRDQFRQLLTELCLEVRTVSGTEFVIGLGLREDIAGQRRFVSRERKPPEPPKAALPATPAAERPQIPAAYKIVRQELKTPPIRLPSGSVVTDVELFVRTTLQQLDARLRGDSWHAGNWPLATLIERLAACGCIVQLNDDGGQSSNGNNPTQKRKRSQPAITKEDTHEK